MQGRGPSSGLETAGKKAVLMIAIKGTSTRKLIVTWGKARHKYSSNQRRSTRTGTRTRLKKVETEERETAC